MQEHMKTHQTLKVHTPSEQKKLHFYRSSHVSTRIQCPVLAELRLTHKLLQELCSFVETHWFFSSCVYESLDSRVFGSGSVEQVDTLLLQESNGLPLTARSQNTMLMLSVDVLQMNHIMDF